jgi:hypothetical protein
MTQMCLDVGDAAELAEMLTFLASWLAGSQNQPWTRARLPSPATPPTTPPRSAPTCTGSASSSAKATARNSSASRRHDQQDRRGTRA